jgi:hypothetical protein
MMKRLMRQRKPKPEVLPSFKERRFAIAVLRVGGFKPPLLEASNSFRPKS